MKANELEKDIEKSILQYLEFVPGCFAWKSNTVGIFDPVRKVYRKQKNKYAINGVADILGIYKGKFIALEVKSRTGKPSQEQKIFLENIERNGGIAGIVRSVDDARKVLGLS